MPLHNNNARPFVEFQPSDHGLLTWAFDPSLCSAPLAVQADGQLNVVKLKLASRATVTAISMILAVAGATLTSGRNFAALYDAGGTLVGATADQTASWGGTTGAKDMTLVTPVVVDAGYCFVGFYATGTTRPSFRIGTGTVTAGTPGLTVATARYALGDTGLTTAPPSVLGAFTAVNYPWWVGLR